MYNLRSPLPYRNVAHIVSAAMTMLHEDDGHCETSFALLCGHDRSHKISEDYRLAPGLTYSIVNWL